MRATMLVALSLACAPGRQNMIDTLRERGARRDRIVVVDPSSSAADMFPSVRWGNYAAWSTSHPVINLLILLVQPVHDLNRVVGTLATSQFVAASATEPTSMAGCPMPNPNADIATRVSAGLVSAYDFQNSDGAGSKLELEIHAESFVWHGRLEWRGSAVLRDPATDTSRTGDEPDARWSRWTSRQCVARGPLRSLDQYSSRCDLLDADMKLLASYCSMHFLAQLGAGPEVAALPPPLACGLDRMARTASHSVVVRGPDPESEIVRALAPDTWLCASPDAGPLGTRRVRLENGTSGYVRDSDLIEE